MLIDKQFTQEELETLHEFLIYRGYSEEELLKMEKKNTIGDQGVFEINGLDGFLAAICSCPTMIPPSRWIPMVWGDLEPQYESQESATEIMGLLMRFYNEVNEMLRSDQAPYSLYIGQRETVDGEYVDILDEWCHGYIRGIYLTLTESELNDEALQKMLVPMAAFTEYTDFEAHKRMEAGDEDVYKHFKELVITNPQRIYDYLVYQPVQQPTNRHKIGRNDPCPCGSGKKYKKCCLH